MSDVVIPIPCPMCGAQLSDGVFSEACLSCGQKVVITKCPGCGRDGLIVIRQKRQRVAIHQGCGWTKIEQGLEDKTAPKAEAMPISCPRCETNNRSGDNFCKECGYPLK